MRSRFTGLLAMTVALGVAPIAVRPAVAAAPATLKIVVAPVTADGHVAAGFSLHAMTDKYPIYCNYKDPSRGAVSPNIESCSPAAAYAPACWNAATPHHVLCLQDASKHKVVRFKRNGRFAKTPIAKPRERAPLVIVLADRTHCTLRIGGAMGPVPNHPNLYAGYFCDRHTAAWVYSKGSHQDPHNGIDESSPSWRIRTGFKHIVWRHIARAYFVATAA